MNVAIFVFLYTLVLSGSLMLVMSDLAISRVGYGIQITGLNPYYFISDVLLVAIAYWRGMALGKTWIAGFPFAAFCVDAFLYIGYVYAGIAGMSLMVVVFILAIIWIAMHITALSRGICEDGSMASGS